MRLFATARLRDDRSLDAAVRARLAETARRHPRGYGLWTWKPTVIGLTLAGVPDGDVVVYCDAGCSLNPEGRTRMVEYLARAAAHPSGVLAFALDGTVGEWTKRATLSAFCCDTPAIRSRPMVSATCLVLRNSAPVRDLVAAWAAGMADLALVDGPAEMTQGMDVGFLARRRASGVSRSSARPEHLHTSRSRPRYRNDSRRDLVARRVGGTTAVSDSCPPLAAAAPLAAVVDAARSLAPLVTCSAGHGWRDHRGGRKGLEQSPGIGR